MDRPDLGNGNVTGQQGPTRNDPDTDSLGDISIMNQSKNKSKKRGLNQAPEMKMNLKGKK